MNHFDYPAEEAEEGVMMRDFGSLFSAPGLHRWLDRLKPVEWGLFNCFLICGRISSHRVVDTKQVYGLIPMLIKLKLIVVAGILWSFRSCVCLLMAGINFTIVGWVAIIKCIEWRKLVSKWPRNQVNFFKNKLFLWLKPSRL